MSDKLKISVLEKLARIPGEKPIRALDKELISLQVICHESTDAYELYECLEALESFSYRLPKKAFRLLTALFDRICFLEQTSTLTESHQYYSATLLKENIIEIISTLKYGPTDDIVDYLLKLSNTDNSKVNSAVKKSLEEISKINPQALSHVGVNPQLVLLQHISDFDNESILSSREMIFAVLDNFLETDLQSTEWDYSTVKWQKSLTPANESTKSLRNQTIELLERYFYISDETAWRKQVIQGFNKACYLYYSGEGGEKTREMVTKNTIQVLSFWRDVVKEVSWEILQKIEHNSYTQFVRSSDQDIEKLALSIRDATREFPEYVIYRELVGYEWTEEDWVESKRSGNTFRFLTQEDGDMLVEKHLSTVTLENVEVWFNRAASFSTTDSSDLATFPRLYKFSEGLAARHPTQIADLLKSKHTNVQKLLISFLAGLWKSGEQDQAAHLCEYFLDNQLYVYACSKLFLNTETYSADLFNLILEKTIESDDLWAATNLLNILIERSETFESTYLNSAVTLILNKYEEEGFTNWLPEVFYRPQCKPFIQLISPEVLELIVRILLLTRDVDHYVEHALALIARRDLSLVMQYFKNRLEIYSSEKEMEGYDAIPYQLDELKKVLAQNPSLVVREIRKWFVGDMQYAQFREAKLVSIIFPEIDDVLKLELMRLIEIGHENDLSFVISVLQSYNGQNFTIPIFVELIKALPENDHRMGHLKGAFESTGVVRGTFGYSESILAKITWLEELKSHDDIKVRNFAENYIIELQAFAEDTRKREMDEDNLRKHEYGKLHQNKD